MTSGRELAIWADLAAWRSTGEQIMASNTDIVRRKRKRRQKNAGHQRKIKQSKQSTLSYDELFAPLGAPGEAAPKREG